jgi:hypothetical protein
LDAAAEEVGPVKKVILRVTTVFALVVAIVARTDIALRASVTKRSSDHVIFTLQMLTWRP